MARPLGLVLPIPADLKSRTAAVACLALPVSADQSHRKQQAFAIRQPALSGHPSATDCQSKVSVDHTTAAVLLSESLRELLRKAGMIFTNIH